ncbi:MAG: hypothetical protein ACW96U_00930 [Candidatus Heimdallarchaeaceae archaeon]
MQIIEDTKKILNKIVSQFSKSGYDDTWQNIEIRYNGTDLYLAGGGHGIVIIHKVKTEGTCEKFAGQIDLRRFFETIKFMGKNIDISHENNKIILKKDRRKVTFQTIYNTFAGILPEKPSALMGSTDGVKIDLVSSDMLNLMKFVANDHLRPSLNHIYISTYKGKTYYTATDSFHLIELKTNMKEVEPFIMNVNIPFPEEEDMYVRTIGNSIVYNTENSVIYQNIINDNMFPDYRRALDSLYGSWKSFSVNRKDLIYALGSAMGFAGGRTSASVTLQIHDNLLTMTSKNKFNIEQDFYVDEIDIKNIDNIKNEIILHTKYFLDGIMSSSEEDVVLNIAKNNNIFITENDRRILLLPMLR